MQLYARRSAHERRGFAALDARNSDQPTARHDSTRGRGACHYQHRSDNDRDADSKHVGMRREHDDESGDARHDAPGQRHGRSGDAGRIACIAIGLLERDDFSPNGHLALSSYKSMIFSENQYPLFRIMLKAENPLPDALA